MSEKIVQLNEEIIKGQLKELVRGSVEETLNELLEKEAQSHLASVLAFERLNFRETYAPDEVGNEVITNSGDHQAAAKPASSIDYRKGNQTQDNILPPLHLAYNSSSVRFCRRDKLKSRVQRRRCRKECMSS